MKKNFLFVGRHFPPRLYNEVKKKNEKIGYSTHNLEMSFLKGLAADMRVEPRVIAVPGVFTYPHNNKAFITSSEQYEYNGIQCKSVGFPNLFILNKIWIIIASIVAILKQFRDFGKGDCYVVINPASFEAMLALRVAMHLTRKKIHVTCFFLDIPQIVTGMDTYNYLKSKILSVTDGLIIKWANKSDHLILMTEEMMDFFEKGKSHIVVEGMIDSGNTNGYNVYQESFPPVILYTGTLRRVFGIMNLIKAFGNIKNKDAQLLICGSGETEREIIEASKKNNNIIFKGLVSSDEARELQSKATILVNPRTSEGKYTKYSFPSKTIEYLLSGSSVIINKIPGIPEEYFNYAYSPDDESVESLTRIIDAVLDKSQEERKKRAEMGQLFIKEKKNAVYQVSKILDMALQ